MKITVIGTGYVGLVSGACMAEVGNNVICLDLDAKKIRILNAGAIPIFEPGLEEMVQRNVAAGRLSFTTNVEEAVKYGNILFIIYIQRAIADNYNFFFSIFLFIHRLDI